MWRIGSGLQLAIRKVAPPSRETASGTADSNGHIGALEKRKRGKVVTVVSDLAAAENDLSALLTQLKNECGAGGTVKGDSIEIQGDQLAKVDSVLANIGYRTRSGKHR